MSSICWKEPTSKSAFLLSWVSTIVTLIFAGIAIAYYKMTGSALCLVFGLENCVDFLSSVVVLWRFWVGVSGTTIITKERELILKRRELRASMAISLILMLLGVGVIATSSFDIATGEAETEQEMGIIVAMAGASVFIFGGLTIFKFHYAHALNSESLYKDGVCSLIGSILAAALFVNTLIIRSRPQIWWLDPCVAMICGFAALFIGFHSIFVAWKHRRVPVCSLSWWFMSRSGDNAGTGNAGIGRNIIKNNNNNINIANDDDDNDDDGITTTTTMKRGSSSDVEMMESTKLSSEIV